jgi:hypothetical protein
VRRVVERLLVDSSPQLAGMFFTSSVAVFSRKGISAVDHPPYSPDLAPAGFWLFPELLECAERKTFLRH